MLLTWDPVKRQANLSKHGLDFVDAEQVFHGFMLTLEDRRKAYGERRFLGLGLLHDTVVAVAFSEPREDTIRVISMRKATKHERRLFFSDGLGTTPVDG